MAQLGYTSRKGWPGVSATTVVALAGIPGAGKTTLARALVARTGWSFISRDDIRAAMFQPCHFTDPEKFSAFQATMVALDTTLELDRSCVIEGMPFSRVGELEKVGEVASKRGATFMPFLIDIPIELAMTRVATESAGNLGRPDAQDRVPELAREVAGRMRTFDESVLQLDGRLPTDLLLEQVMAYIDQGYLIIRH
jgi:predicted kinase